MTSCAGSEAAAGIPETTARRRRRTRPRQTRFAAYDPSVPLSAVVALQPPRRTVTRRDPRGCRSTPRQVRIACPGRILDRPPISPPARGFCVKFKKGDTIIYPQHGACIVMGTKKMEAFGEKREVSDPPDGHQRDDAEGAGQHGRRGRGALTGLGRRARGSRRRAVQARSSRAVELEPAVQEPPGKLKSGDVYQVAEVVRNLATRNRAPPSHPPSARCTSGPGST